MNVTTETCLVVHTEFDISMFITYYMYHIQLTGGRHGRDCMVVRFTTYAISAYHHYGTNIVS